MSELYVGRVEELMRQWGLRALKETERLGVKPTCLSKVRGSTVSSASITDEDFAAVDASISQLASFDKMSHDVAGYIFICRMNQHQIQKEMKIGCSTIHACKRLAIGWVASSINSSF